MFDHRRFARLETILSEQKIRFLEMMRTTERAKSGDDKLPGKPSRVEAESSSVYDHYNGW